MFEQKQKKYLWWCCIILAAAQFSCSGSEENVDNCVVISDTVPASPWVRESSGIAHYRYSGTFSDNDLNVEVLDSSSKVLAEIVVSQVLSGDQDLGAMTATLSHDGKTSLTLVSRGHVDVSGYDVHTTLSTEQTSVDVRTRFENTSCQGITVQQRALCAGPVPVEDSEYTVPSCGLVWNTSRAYGETPALRKLSYSVPVGGDVPTLGGVSTTLGAFTLDVLDGSRILPAEDVKTWLTETGAKQIIGSRDEELLSAFFTDDAWSKAFEQHLAACDATQETRQAKLESCAKAKANLATQEQAVDSCGGAGARDESGWADSGSGGGPDCEGGCVHGDPHFTSFDRFSFDFQGVGEFVFAQSTNETPFMVQARLKTMDAALPICQNISLNSAVAFKIGERRIAIYVDREQQLWVDGAPLEVNPGMTIDLPPGASFEASKNRFVFVWPSGEKVTFVTSGYPSIDIHLPDSRHGSIEGLLGTFNGDIDDEFKLRKGPTLIAPLSFDAMYRNFGDSWRVAQHESLFDYDPNENTDTFTDLNFPTGPADSFELPDDIREEALTACREQGLSDPWLIDACVLDFVCSSDAMAPTTTMDNMAIPRAHAETGEVSLKLGGQLRLSRPTPSFAPTDVKIEGYCPGDLLDTIWIFKEGQKIPLDSELGVDAKDSGTYDSQSLNNSTIATSIEVFSYLIHFDQNGQEKLLPATGSVTFSSEILGVIATPEKLAATDLILGIQNTEYPVTPDRGPDTTDDSFTISADRKTLSVKFRGAQNIDQLRVVIAAPQGEIE